MPRDSGIGRITKRYKKTFGSDGYIHRLDYGDDFTHVYLSKHINLCTLKKKKKKMPMDGHPDDPVNPHYIS